MKSLPLFLAVGWIAVQPVLADSLRGALRGEVLPDGKPVVIGLDEVAMISLPDAADFAKALEIEIAIPRDAYAVRSSLAVYVYQHYQKGPTATSATGDRVALEVFPPASKFYLEAPLVAKSGMKASLDTAVLKIPQGGAAFPLAITILPIDKGLPDGYEKFQFGIKSRLVNANLGAVNLLTPDLSPGERARLTVTANGAVVPANGPILLEPGPYSLTVSLPGADVTTVSVVVLQAKTIDVPVKLDSESPSVIVEAPEGTQLIIDGKRISWKPQTPIPIEMGTHSVQFLIGSTVVSDTFTIDKAGRHRLALQLSMAFSRD